MKRLFIIALSVICTILISCAYFLCIYNDVGFVFTVKCLAVWGFCLLAYTMVLAVFFYLIDHSL